jgi:transcriptional regulator with XRE-family HTH domain
MELHTVPNKLKKYRRCAGYSQKKVARMLGLSDTSPISRWEHGAALPTIKYLFKLSQVYHTLPHVLFDALWLQAAQEQRLSITNTNLQNETMYQ